MHEFIDAIRPSDYDAAITLTRNFFKEKGFIEVGCQHRLSILAACEDPKTIATFDYAGSVWPLPQTGQMHLEYELLTEPNVPGYFCSTTSYRNEASPVPGRHSIIFPMFEFELAGDLSVLAKTEAELLAYIGFGPAESYSFVSYLDAAAHYGVTELTAAEESKMAVDYNPITFLTHFPVTTSPFWNMSLNESNASLANKIDVIMHGIETIGSAERSVDKEQMRNSFHTISEGMYADILYQKFGKERVEAELEDFLSLDFFPRCGGGIGVTRLIRAMKLSELIKP